MELRRGLAQALVQEDCNVDALRALLQEALAAIGKVDGVSRLVNGGTDHPWTGLDDEAAYQAGMIEGAAAALDVTVAELLDELGLG